MASAFQAPRIEGVAGLGDAAAVRHLPFVVALAAACAGAPGPTPSPAVTRPEVPVAERLASGTHFTTMLAPGLPDAEPWRAAAVWWREALRQSAAFTLAETRDPTLPGLELHLEPTAMTFVVFWRRGDERLPLAGGRIGSSLPAAIDQAAWSARLALGEAAPPPLPIDLGTTHDPALLSAIADARDLLRDGGIDPAYRLLRDQRRRDGAAPFLLDALAETLLLRGDAAAAERLCREALSYERRLLPDVQHRLARTLLLARASLGTGGGAATQDRELLRLGEVGHRERPFDPEPRLTLGIASNFLGEFAAAREHLTVVRAARPEAAIAAYHLGWACLGAGDAAAALAPLADAALRLPTAWVVLPRALALHESNHDQELEGMLTGLLADPANADAPFAHDVRRMLAAQALLRHDHDGARRHLLADFDWLLTHPLVLEKRAGEFAEQGAVLVRLGGSPRLLPLLTALQQQHPGAAVADACAFVGGMDAIASSPAGAAPALAALDRGADNVWHALLQAFLAEYRGEIGTMQEQLARAARLSDSPMTKALLARGLLAGGRAAEGRQLLDTLRREMRRIDLRRPCQHPLLGPELAFAFLEPDAARVSR